MPSGIRWEDDTLFDRLESFGPDIERKIARTVDFFTPRVESYARVNAPWQDQTGNARQGLMSQSSHAPRHHAIDLFHSVPYGIYLEVRFEGRYAIIIPTIQSQGRALMALLGSTLFSKVTR